MELYENTLRTLLKSDILMNRYHVAVYARDELPKSLKYPCCLILNTDTRSEPGEHWLALHITPHGFLSFFDSYGNSPHYFNLEKKLAFVSSAMTWNKQRIQGSSELCGYYCIAYLFFKVRGREREFYSKFSHKFEENDRFIIEAIHKELI
jgi:hypothetical protein